jgi:predicted RND superfamily exporter protein
MADHKIAVIFTGECYNSYGDYEKVIERCTEFAVVSDEELKLLQTNKTIRDQYGQYTQFEIVEVPTNPQGWVDHTVTSLLEKAKEAEKKKQRLKNIAAEMVRKNKAKNEANVRENKLKQLQKLQKELGLTDADAKVS